MCDAPDLECPVSLILQEGRGRNIQPRMVNRMLMRRSAPQPLSRKTPTGGRKIAMMILQISEVVKGILKLVVGWFVCSGGLWY